MNPQDVKIGEGTLQTMNREIEANKAAIAEMKNPTPKVVPDMTMKKGDLIALAKERDVAIEDDATKEEIIGAIEAARDAKKDAKE